MNRYITVVYEIDDEASFAKHREEIFSRFAVPNEDHPDWRVTAVSMEDEISRVEQMELESESWGS